MQIVIRPLNRNPWSGIIRYKDCHEALGPYLTRSGALYTGLTEADEKRIGDKIGKDLRSGSDFWDTFRVKFGATDMYLDTADILDELKYLFLKSHKRVASGLSDRNPSANYVIINHEEEAKEVNTFSKLERRAIKEFDKLTPGDMRKCLRLFGLNAETMSNDLVEQKLYEIVKGNPDKFLSKWVDNDSKTTEYLIEAAISKNIIKRNKTIYKFGSDIIGNTLEDTISYLDSPANRDIKDAIAKQI
jgi:hypothetical protein